MTTEIGLEPIVALPEAYTAPGFCLYLSNITMEANDDDLIGEFESIV